MSDDRPAAGGTARAADPLEAGGMGRTRRGGGAAPRAPSVGLFGALAGALVRRAGQVLGNTAAASAPAAAPLCSICGKGAREGLHVAPVFRLRPTRGAVETDMLIVPIDHARHEARPMCLADATRLLGEATLTGVALEVEA